MIMKTLLTIVAAVTLSAAVSLAVVRGAGPSTDELDAVIASTKTEISTTEAEAVQYASGLILAEAQIRIAVLKSTLAMLEQKRQSFLRGINLVYQEPTPRLAAPADDAAAVAELAKARADVTAAQMEAASYSGGLIRMMALVREATAKATEATIEQRIAFMKLGIPLAALPSAGSPVPKTPGNVTTDKDAL